MTVEPGQRFTVRFGPRPDQPGAEETVAVSRTIMDLMNGRHTWLVTDRVAIRFDPPMAVIHDVKQLGQPLATLPASLTVHMALLAGEAAVRAWYDGYAAGKADSQLDIAKAGEASGFEAGHAAGIADGRAALQRDLQTLLGLSQEAAKNEESV